MGRAPAENSGVRGVSAAVASRLNDLLTEAGLDSLDAKTAGRFADYCALLLRWNARMNLTAIRDEEGILSRHFAEGIACARALPDGIATLLDFGSGAGFPGIPIALCRPEIAVTLGESQGKKAAFLHEAVRALGISAAVHSGRAESLTFRFDCVTLRAVDRMPQAVQAASELVGNGGWLAIMTTEGELAHVQSSFRGELSWLSPMPLPGGDTRVLALGQRRIISRA
jgi:16S rRNA (guanine527-N7)-methyltransferase